MASEEMLIMRDGSRVTLEEIENDPDHPMHQYIHYFKGFPYLLTQLTASVFHIELLPGQWNIKKLIKTARKQYAFNNDWQVGWAKNRPVAWVEE